MVAIVADSCWYLHGPVCDTVPFVLRDEQVLQESMKKKELKPVDHSKIAYIDIRKNLYIIPKSLGSASEEKASTPSAYIVTPPCAYVPPVDL